MITETAVQDEVQGSSDVYVPESERELLRAAWVDAMAARSAGVLGGPGLDEVGFAYAEREAERRDAARRTRVALGLEAA